jgi:plastocyanin
LLKKITLLGIISVVTIIILALAFSNIPNQENDVEPNIIVEADIIMPSKVSRPGCEDDDRCYIPSNIVIEKGKQVTWVNEDSAFHSVTSGFYDTPTELFDSGHLDPFESYTLTFDESGVYDYFCTLHPWMKGQLIVE